MKTMKSILGLMAAVLFSLTAAVTTAQAGSVLKIVPHADLKNTDPIWTTAYITRNHGYMIYDTLFAMDETFNVHPQMAGSHSVSDDGLVHIPYPTGELGHMSGRALALVAGHVLLHLGRGYSRQHPVTGPR